MAAISADRRVNVSVRLRATSEAVTVPASSTVLTHAGKPYAFDAVLAGDQDAAFSRLGTPMLDEVCCGISTCLFAYGQTGSGKTYSIFGTDDAPGILPQFVAALVEILDNRVETRQVQSYKLFASCVEVYQEEVRDLLASSSFSPPLEVVQGSHGYAAVAALSSHRITSAATILSLLGNVLPARRVAATDANAASSRSHAIFRLRLVQFGVEADTEASATFVDLAGSERVGSAGGASVRAAEGIQINQALLTLGRLLHAVGSPSGDVTGFRESKLTRLLEENIMGNCRLRMLATVSSRKEHVAETTSTLQFATHIRSIRAKRDVVAGLIADSSRSNIRALRDQLATLHASLRSAAVGLAEATVSASDVERATQMELDAVEGLLFVRRSVMADRRRILSNCKPAVPAIADRPRPHIVRLLSLHGSNAIKPAVVDFSPQGPLSLEVAHTDGTLMIRVLQSTSTDFLVSHTLELRLAPDDPLVIPIELSAIHDAWISLAGISLPTEIQFTLTTVS